jgi:CRP-like cAMP-binding protein
MADKTDLLTEFSRHPFVAGITPEMVEELAGCIVGLESWDSDEVVFRSGGPADRCYLIRTGEVAIEVHSPGAGSRILQTVSRGEVLGWSWLFEPHRWAFDARVLTPTEAIVLDGRKVRECIAEHTELGFEVMTRFAELIAERLRATRLQLLDLYASRN